MTLRPPPPVAVARGPWGVLVVVAVDPAASWLAALPAAEQALAASWGARRRATFAAGRLALREALVAAGVAATIDAVDVVGRDDRGAPVLPPDLAARARCSITHKDTHAAALVLPVDGGSAIDPGHVGVDLELDDARPRARTDALARQVLTPDELARLPEDDDARRRALLVRFAAKEALYKAIDKTLRRYVGFLEVTVDVDADGHVAFVPPAGAGLAAAGAIVDTGDPALVVVTCHARAAR